MKFEVCCEVSGGLKRYYLSDNSGYRSSITFIASNVLSYPVIMSSSDKNTGGWAKYTLNTYLNNRVYNAFPEQWRQLMKQVKVRSSVGNKSNETSTSDCYIFIPSIYEVDSTVATEPYVSEGTPISHFINPQTRICYTPQGEAVHYWTRSPSTTWDSYVYRITNTGANQAVTSLSDATVYARIMISI